MDISALSQAVSGDSFSSSIGLLAQNAQAQETERKFASLIDGIRAGMDTDSSKSQTSDTASQSEEILSSSSLVNDPRLPGDYISSFHTTDPSAADHVARPSGAAANAGQKGKIDKTSKLYEQALELESYFVKIMLSSMRNTVSKPDLTGGNDFASNMYDDMLYDELSRTVTKNAGFGIADQIYLQLDGES